MSEIQWGLLDPNSFQRGYQQTKAPFDDIIATQKKAQLDDAMRQYALHPQDPNALNALAVASPETAIPLMRQQQTDHLKALEQHRDSIKLGAQIIRQVQPKDQASWDQARALAAQAGVSMAEVPTQFDPQYVQGIVQVADALDPPKAEAQPNIQREVDYYRSIGRDDLAQQLLQHHAEGPPVMVENPDGTKTLYPRQMLQGAQSRAPQPGTVEDGYRFKGGDPADAANWEPVGGPTPQASGVFRP